MGLLEILIIAVIIGAFGAALIFVGCAVLARHDRQRWG